MPLHMSKHTLLHTAASFSITPLKSVRRWPSATTTNPVWQCARDMTLDLRNGLFHVKPVYSLSNTAVVCMLLCLQ